MNWPALVGLAALPYVAFRLGSLAISKATDRKKVLARLQALPEKEEQVHLNQRIRGYEVPSVQRVWKAIDEKPSLLHQEQAALHLDLVVPVLYGAALGTSLLLTWRAWKGTSGAWLLVPVVIYLVADWTENAVQLRQLRLYREEGPDALEAGWVQVASNATTIKLVCFLGCQLAAAGFVAMSLVKD